MAAAVSVRRARSYSGVDLVWNLGVVDPGIQICPRRPILKEIDFSGNFTKSVAFHASTSEKFRLFHAILQIFRFSRQIQCISEWPFLLSIYSQISVYPEKVVHLQLLLGKLFYISSKVTTFEQRPISYWVCRPYRYSLIMFHDPSTSPLTPHDPQPIIWGSRPTKSPTPGLTPMWSYNMHEEKGSRPKTPG